MRCRWLIVLYLLFLDTALSISSADYLEYVGKNDYSSDDSAEIFHDSLPIVGKEPDNYDMSEKTKSGELIDENIGVARISASTSAEGKMKYLIEEEENKSEVLDNSNLKKERTAWMTLKEMIPSPPPMKRELFLTGLNNLVYRSMGLQDNGSKKNTEYKKRKCKCRNKDRRTKKQKIMKSINGTINMRVSDKSINPKNFDDDSFIPKQSSTSTDFNMMTTTTMSTTAAATDTPIITTEMLLTTTEVPMTTTDTSITTTTDGTSGTMTTRTEAPMTTRTEAPMTTTTEAPMTTRTEAPMTTTTTTEAPMTTRIEGPMTTRIEAPMTTTTEVPMTTPTKTKIPMTMAATSKMFVKTEFTTTMPTTIAVATTTTEDITTMMPMTTMKPITTTKSSTVIITSKPSSVTTGTQEYEMKTIPIMFSPKMATVKARKCKKKRRKYIKKFRMDENGSYYKVNTVIATEKMPTDKFAQLSFHRETNLVDDVNTVLN